MGFRSAMTALFKRIGTDDAAANAPAVAEADPAPGAPEASSPEASSPESEPSEPKAAEQDLWDALQSSPRDIVEEEEPEPEPEPVRKVSLIEAALADRKRVTAADIAKIKGKRTEIRFDQFAEHFGDQWAGLLARARVLTESVIKRFIDEETDTFIENGDEGYYVFYANMEMPDEELAERTQEIFDTLVETLVGGDEWARRKRKLYGAEAEEAARLAAEEEAKAADVAKLAEAMNRPVEDEIIEVGDESVMYQETVVSADIETDATGTDDGMTTFGKDKADGAGTMVGGGEGPDGDGSSRYHSDDRGDAGDGGLSDGQGSDDSGFSSGDGSGDDSGFDASGDRPAGDTDWGMTGELPSDAETDWGSSGTDDGSGFDTSGDRDGASGDFGASGDRGEVTGDFGDSLDRPTDVHDVPIAEDKPERPSLFGEGGFFDESVSNDFDATSDKETVIADFGQTDDPDAAPPVVMMAGRYEDDVLDVPLADDRAAPPSGLFAASDDKPVRPPLFGNSDDRPSVLGDFGSTDDKAERPPLFGASGDRPEVLGDFGQTDTKPEDEFGVPTSGDKDEAPPVVMTAGRDPDEQETDWGQSGTIEDPEFGVPTSGDRPSEDLDVPTSGDRDEAPPVVMASGRDEAEAEYDWGQTDMIPDSEFDVPTSEDRPTEESDVPTSGDRDEAPPVVMASGRDPEGQDPDWGQSGTLPDTPVGDFGTTETRAEAEIEVPTSGDRPVADIAVPTSQDKGVDKDGPVMITESHRTANTVFMVRQGEVDPNMTRRVSLHYSGFLDTRAGIVTSYLAVPMRPEKAGLMVSCLDAARTSHSDAAAFAVDMRTVEAAARDLKAATAAGRQFILGLPVAASTVLRPKLRAEYMKLWRSAFDEAASKRIRCYCYHLPEGTGLSQLREATSFFRQLGQPPIIDIQPKAGLVQNLAGIGVFGAAIDYDLWSRRLGPTEFEQQLMAVVKKAHAAKLALFMTNVWDGAGIITGHSFKCDFVEVRHVGRVENIPRELVRENVVALADAMDTKPSAATPAAS